MLSIIFNMLASHICITELQWRVKTKLVLQNVDRLFAVHHHMYTVQQVTTSSALLHVTNLSAYSLEMVVNV